MVQPGLQQRLGATIIIETSRASGSRGTAQAAKSPPDGSNWVFVFDTHAVNPFLQSLPFDTEKDSNPAVGDDQTVQRNSLLGYLKFPGSFTEMPCSEGIWRHLPKSLD